MARVCATCNEPVKIIMHGYRGEWRHDGDADHPPVPIVLPTPRDQPPADRLAAGVKIDERGCWVWQRTRTPLGYGRIRVDGRNEYTHRLAWIMFRGPIPEGCEVDHLCRNTSCCNPRHLEPVPHAENTRRQSNHTVTHCPQGHPYDEQNTYVDKRGRRQCRTCGNIRRRRARNGGRL